MKETLDQIGREIEVLKAIQRDTAATLSQLSSIANALSNPPRPPAPQPPSGPAPRPRPAPPVPPPSPAPRPPSPAPIPPAPPPAGPPSPDRGRDESGRWRPRNPVPPGQDGAPPENSPSRPGSSNRATEAMGDAAASLKGAAGALASGADGIDPTVQAVKEIGGIFQPIMGVLRPMGRMFGIGRRPEQKNQRENVSWYRRIWNALRAPGGGGGGGMGLIMTALLSMLGMIMAPIKALGALTGITGLVKGLGSLFGAGAGSAGGGLLKGILKKIPFIGALIGGGLLASDLMAGDDPNLTPQENKTKRYGNVGSSVGGLVGGVLGMLGGPAGAIAGAVIGDKLGGMVGNWLSTVDLTSITKAWGGMVTTAVKLLTGMTDSIKETFRKVADVVLGIKDTISDKVQSSKEFVSSKAASAKDSAQNSAYKISGGRLGADGSDGRKAELIKAMDAGGITDQKSKAMLMANVDHESGGLTKNEENLNYSAKRLQEVFPKYYSTPEAARADANNPEAIANKVYGNRMGNNADGDGYKYRGRGAIQLTGKAQYAAMGKALGIDLENNPELAMDPKYSAQIAVQHWKSSGADKAAMAGDQVRARKLTNGGTNGLGDVQAKYDGYLAQAKAGDLTPTRRADQGKVQAPYAANAALASTMSAVRGSPPVGVMPIGPSPSAAPGLSSTQPVGVMAPAIPAMSMASIKPVSASTMVAPSYAAPAPDASLVKFPTMPVVEKPQMSPSKAPSNQAIQMSVPLSQNLEDRQIAHVSSGGIGMN